MTVNAEDLADDASGYLATEEVAAIICGWRRADIERMMLYARRLICGRPLGCTEGDIVSQTCEKLLKGKRRIPRSVEFVKGYVRVMRSLVSNRITSSEYEIYRLHDSLPDDRYSDDAPFISPHILRQLQERRTPETELMYKRALEALEEMFPDAKDRALYEMRYMYDQDPEVVREELNLSDKEYETRMKRIQRKWRKRDDEN